MKTCIINRLKFLFLGIGYISNLSQGIPIKNTYGPETQQDCQTLIEIYKHFKLNLPPFASNNQNCCDINARLAASNDGNPTTDWMCDSSNSRINSIILRDKGIETDIPWDLFQKLDKLEVLHLYDNKIKGEIKGDLRQTFPNLKQLRIQNNNLSGYLPTYLPPQLETIIISGNDQIKDSIPKEWQEKSSLKDCVLSNNICNPRSSNISCYASTKGANITSCQNDAQEDRSKALQKLNSNNNNNNNNNDNNNTKIDNNKPNNNNGDNTNNNNNNNNNNNDNSINNQQNHKVSSKRKRSYAVLIMTGSIIMLLIFILIIITIVSHFSRKRIREKEKEIYKGTTMYNESNSRTEASIFYSKTNSNDNLMSFDEGNINSISLFNCINRRNSQNSQTTDEHKLLSDNQSEDEISFIENSNPNNMNSVEMSFSVIDPSQEIIEPAPALLQSPNVSYI